MVIFVPISKNVQYLRIHLEVLKAGSEVIFF